MAGPAAARRRRLPPSHLQTKEGKEARGVTPEEFNDLMRALVKKLQEDHQRSLKRGERWQISYDNAAVHTDAEQAVPGINRLPHPPKSPDMHKAVEHVHAWLTQKMQAWLLKQEAGKITAEAAKAQLRELFGQLHTESVMKDVNSLNDTYKAILSVGGRYPTKHFR